MKSKFVILSLLLNFTTLIVLGQSDIFSLGNSVIDPYDMHHILKNGQKSKIDLSSVEGSPYEITSFKFGSAVDKLTNSKQNFYLRFNAYNDEIQMKPSLDEKNIYGLVKAPNIYVIINAREYHYLSYIQEEQIMKGYFILVSKTAENQIYLRRTKRFKPGQPAKDSFRAAVPAAFKDNMDRYYYEKDDILHLIAVKKKGKIF